jgi:arsenate reductase
MPADRRCPQHSFNKFADQAKAKAISAGTHPASHVHPEVVQAMHEVGIDLSAAKPQRLTEQLARGADLLVTMGCGDECPYIPGLRRDDWPLPDPKGKGIEQVRAIRTEIEERTLRLIASEAVGKTAPEHSGEVKRNR